MNTHFRISCFSAIIMIILLSQCTIPPTDISNPTGILTPTPTITPGYIPDPKTRVESLSGTLEMRFPDPWERPEFCSSEISYTMTPAEGHYQLLGEGKFYCYQVMTYEDGGGLKHHLEQDYDVLLSGLLPFPPDSILEMTVTMSGIQENYFSDYPEDAPEIITTSNPFHVDISQPINLRFQNAEGAYCVWNNQGVFTSLPGEEPPTGESGWLFILHPGQ